MDTAKMTQGHPLRMEYRYNLCVVEIKQNRTFTRQNQTWFNYRVSFQDSHGLVYLAEYVTMDQHQNDFVPGVSVCFRVSSYNNLGFSEVVPIKDCKQTAEKVLMGDKVKPVMTESYGVALKCATELMAAMIMKSDKPIEMEEILDKTCTMAEDLDLWLLMRQTERLVGDN